MGLLLGTAAGLVLARRRPSAALLDEPGPGLDQAAMGVLLIRDRKVRWANARAAELLGVSAPALRGADTRAFHQDLDAYQRFAQTPLASAEQAEGYHGDARLRRADGSPFWAYVAGAPLLQGHPEHGILWFLEDVTERVEAQLDLAEVLSLNQKLIAASPTGIMLYRAADGACVLANEAAARIDGARQEDLLRQNFRRLASWKTSGLRDAADQALASGLEQHLECHFQSTFGADVAVVAHFAPIVSRGERLLLLLVDDVSGQMKASLALRASEEKYRVVVEALSEGLALVDMNGCLMFCNTRLLDMAGLKQEEVLGKHYTQFVDEKDRATLLERRILQQPREATTFELGLRCGDGSITETRVSVAYVHDALDALDPLKAPGTASALAILVTDISAGKRIERERERLLGELEQKNKELETLLYVASHDLRSPLVNIQGFSQRLAKSLEDLGQHLEAAGSLDAFKAAVAPLLQDRMPSSLAFIRASGTRMDAIINGLLTLSRAGRMVLKAELLDMDALVQSCAATLAYQFQSVAGTLQVEPLPPCRADAAQTAQILSNLLDNAVKYRHPDRPLRVRIWGRPADGFSEYWVEDNGLGIAPEHRERIWEIFQRLDPQGPTPGDGLGLTLVRRMAERNGGRIRMGSAPEHGCQFILELPGGA